MLVSDVTSGGTVPMLEKTLAFTEARNRMLADNIANVLTPGYRTKQLDVSAFQAAMKDAWEKRTQRDGQFRLESSGEVQVSDAGQLQVTPSQEPAENLLFQDGTNARIERQMAQLAENTLMSRTAVELMRQSYEVVAKAIRGRPA